MTVNATAGCLQEEQAKDAAWRRRTVLALEAGLRLGLSAASRGLQALAKWGNAPRCTSPPSNYAHLAVTPPRPLAAQAGPSEPPLDLVAARAAYDMQWEQLEAAALSASSLAAAAAAARAPLQYWDIPWPLEGLHGTGGSAGKRPPPAHAPPPPRVDALRDFFLVGASGPADIKKRLRVELLRW